MKKIQFLLVALFPICLLAQSEVTKTKLQKIIKHSQVEYHDNKFSLPSKNSWKFDNTDSLYFKIDTLTANIYKSGKHKSMCELIDWTFYRKNSFILGEESNCKEPPSRKVEKYPDKYFTVSIYNVDKEVIIDVLRYDKMIVESFIVIKIQENPEVIEIKLVRRFKV